MASTASVFYILLLNPPMSEKASNRRKPVLDRSILVVEDDPDIQAMTVAVLENAGAKVATAASAREALEVMRESKFDAVLLDWNLSDITGSALLESMRERDPELFARCAVVTGDLMSIPGQHEAERFGRPVLAKPFRPSQLIDTVTSILSHQSKGH